TGKVGHIFRPKIIDSAGTEVWGDLHIENGILSVTIPQNFLDKAVYPVIVDPTFGYTTIGATGGATPANYLVGTRANPTVTATGTVDSISIYGSGSGVNFKGTVLNTSMNIITNGVSPSGSFGAGAGWVSANYTTKPTVSTGTDYYSGAVVNGTATIYYDTGGGATDAFYDATNNFTTPTNPTDALDNPVLLSVYFTYTASTTATVSCSAPTSTSFGALTNASVFTSSPNASTTMSCSGTSAGCTLYMKDAGSGSNPGLWKSASPTYLIVSADATLSAGADGYGIQATTTAAGSGGTLSFNSKYNKTGNDVGGLTLTNTILASSTVDVTNREAVVTHKAAVSSNTLSGTYSDTITYSCLVN
ncbi:MAG: hypothetical protein NUV83_01770, partial [Candidatus Wolfebacteria bacterium]|nr:hypothetical protein [Candidatus Wolfebacteria bacterium]